MAQSSYVYGVFVLSVYAIDLVVLCMGPVAYFFTRFWLSSYISVAQDNHSVMLSAIERVFAVLVVMTASVMAFSHGANDVANAIGPMVSALNILRSGNVEFTGVVPIWVCCGATGVAIGVSTYGYKVMQRVGEENNTFPSVVLLHACRYCCTICVIGFPVSTTQILVGGVMGVGLARGLAAIDLSVVRHLFIMADYYSFRGNVIYCYYQYLRLFCESSNINGGFHGCFYTLEQLVQKLKPTSSW